MVFAVFTFIDCPFVMQILTLEITNDNAYKVLQDLVEKHFIKIPAKPDLNDSVFPGSP